MKKNIVCILIICALNTLPAITPSITFGVQDSNVASYHLGKFYVDITLTQPIGNLSLYSNYRNEMNLSRIQPLRFEPTQDYYTVGASYDFEFATIRVEHMCMHPVVSGSQWDGLQGGYTRFEITLGD